MKTIDERLTKLEAELEVIKAVWRHRKNQCGKQRARDHNDGTTKYLGKRLPTFNPCD